MNILDEIFEELDESTLGLQTDLLIFKAVKSYRSVDLGEAEAEYIIWTNNLQGYLEHFKSIIHSNFIYYRFVCRMVLSCYEAAYHLRLSKTGQRSLLLAALFFEYDENAGVERPLIEHRSAADFLRSVHQDLLKSRLAVAPIELVLALEIMENAGGQLTDIFKNIRLPSGNS